MENKNIFLIIVGSLIVLFILRSILFEQKEISTENWGQTYRFDSDDPYGAKVFYELVKQKYGEENVVRNHVDTLLTQVESTGNLYVMMSNQAYIKQKELQKIKNFIAKGNNTLIISQNRYSDLTPGFSSYENFEYESEHDSVFNFSFNGMGDSLSYKHYSGSNKEASIFYPTQYTTIYDSSFTALATEDTSNVVFFKKQLDTGEVYQHFYPHFFSNIAAQQEFYLDNFNSTFNYLEGDLVILDHPSFNRNLEEELNTSPIQYVLEQKSLRWAYYLFLSTTICFLLFRGKRKQRIIPIPEKNENTSIQYVDTLSNLFEQQDQNEKLVPHMETVFMQRIKKKYYLTRDNDKFVELLSKKSRIPEQKIIAILNYFNSSGQDFSDDQLIMLHQRLEEFYNNAE